MALSATPLIQAMIDLISHLANRLLLAALSLLVGIIIARLAGRLTFKLLSEIEINVAVRRITGLEASIDDTISALVAGAAYVLTFLFALNILGVDVFVLNALSLIVIGILLLSALISLQYAVPNIFAGFIVNQRKMVRKDDILRLRGLQGRVTHTGLFEITIQTKDKEIIYIPNRSLLQEKHFTVKRDR